jgi:hypothetical protein
LLEQLPVTTHNFDAEVWATLSILNWATLSILNWATPRSTVVQVILTVKVLCSSLSPKLAASDFKRQSTP